MTGTSLAHETTRRRILDAAADRLQRFGPLKTSMADIARDLRMSPANLYNFFPCKTALLEELGELFFCQDRAAITELVATSADPWMALRRVVIHIAHLIRRRIRNEKDVIQLEIMEETNDWRFIRNFHGFVLATLTDLVAAIAAARGLHGIDSAHTAQALFDCLATAVEPAMVLKIPPEEHERRLNAQLDLLERAFLPADGPDA
jgi:AcrR family transcriptional regulator